MPMLNFPLDTSMIFMCQLNSYTLRDTPVGCKFNNEVANVIITIGNQVQLLGMSTLCQNNFKNNRWLKESGIILE